MGTGSKLQPTVYDLSDKSLAAQAKFLSETHIVDIQVKSLLEPGKDEKVRVDNRKHLENTIKNLHNLVHNDLKPILLKERVTKEEQKEIDDKNFFKEFKLYRTLNAIRLRMQIEEAVFLLGEREKLLEKLHHLKEILQKLADAKHAEDVEIAEAERLKFEQDIHAMVMDSIHGMKDEAQKKWDHHQDEIDKANERLSSLFEKRDRIIQEHIPEVRNAADSYFQSSKAADTWANISDDKKNLFIKNIIEKRNKKEIDKLKLPVLKEDNAEYKIKLQQIIEKENEIQKKTIGDIAATTSALQQEKTSHEFKGLTTRFQFDRQAQRVSNQKDELHDIKQQRKIMEDMISKSDAEISAIEQDSSTDIHESFVETFDDAYRAAMLAQEPDLFKNLQNDKAFKGALDKADSALHGTRIEINEVERTKRTHGKAQEKIEEEHNQKVQEVGTKASLPVSQDARADFRAQRKLRNANAGLS